MACKYGKVKPNHITKLRLLSDSAGCCNNPECQEYLFSFEGSTSVYFAEFAHILAGSKLGPRPAYELEHDQLACYDNLILLCPNCHTIVDKCPDKFPKSLLIRWKLKHKETIASSIGIRRVSSRQKAFNFIDSLLCTNKSIHSIYGPDNSYRENPEAEEQIIWKNKMVSQIIPNNQKILLFIDKNYELLHEDERGIVERFRQHVDDLIERHLINSASTASRFPADMKFLFR